MERREKLKTYFTGFGIGLILVGFIIYARWRYAQANPPPPPPQQQQPQQSP
ncbi:MAG: hypothetical protein RIE77_02445 [Phycisphaerales bacterium]|jgi:hypothetical protein